MLSSCASRCRLLGSRPLQRRSTLPWGQRRYRKPAARAVSVLVLDDWEGLIHASPAVAALRSKGVSVTTLRPHGPGQLCPRLADLGDGHLAGVNVLVPVRERTSPIDAGVFDRMPALELIAQTGGHAYHLDEEEATRRGVLVSLGRGMTASGNSVPELTFALAIAALRSLPEAFSAMHGSSYPTMMGRTLGGKRMGLLGGGRLGKHVARIADAFGMDVVAWDRTERGDASAAIPRLPLAELLATSDVVSIHLKLSDESRGLLDADKLAHMKPGSVLVTTSRGAIVDEDALACALSDVDHPLSAAGLDVFVEEPLPTTSPLRQLPNAVMTPHIGFTVEEVFQQFAAIACRQIEAYLGGSLPTSEVLNPAALKHSRERVTGSGCL